MDWLISDRFETPPDLAHLYSEKLLILPDSYICYDPPREAPPVAPLPARRSGAVTFGSFNNLMKVTPSVVATWASVMRRVEGSRLLIKAPQLDDPETAERLLSAFTTYGISRERVEISGSSEHHALLQAYNRVDLTLQTFPYCGGVTLLESLWMGVPSIAMRGESFAARHGVSHLSNAGLHDFLADSKDDYVERAATKAGDLSVLSDLRATLRDRLQNGPLCDSRRFGRHLGTLLRMTWTEFCKHS